MPPLAAHCVRVFCTLPITSSPRSGAMATKRARGDDAELFWAARFGRVGQLRELLQRGAALDSVDPSHGHTALTAAASAVCGLAQPHHANTATREG